jgi:hypothetical protein
MPLSPNQPIPLLLLPPYLVLPRLWIRSTQEEKVKREEVEVKREEVEVKREAVRTVVTRIVFGSFKGIKKN